MIGLYIIREVLLWGVLDDSVRPLLSCNKMVTHFRYLESLWDIILTFWKFVTRHCFCLSFDKIDIYKRSPSPRTRRSWGAGVTSIDTPSSYYFIIVIHISQKQGIYREGCPNWLHLKQIVKILLWRLGLEFNLLPRSIVFCHGLTNFGVCSLFSIIVLYWTTVWCTDVPC